MHGNVGAAIEERFLDLFEKEPLSTNRRQGPVDDPISRGDDVQLFELHVGMQVHELLQELSALRECERAAPSGYHDSSLRHETDAS
jgi:hypothetical protein